MPGIPFGDTEEVRGCYGSGEWRDQGATNHIDKPTSIGYTPSSASASKACDFYFEEVRLIEETDGHGGIVRELCDREGKHRSEPDYLSTLRSSKRCRLGEHRRRIVQWMLETQSELEASLSTTLIAIHYLDTILARQVIQGDVDEIFDLFGTACLLIAFKFDCTENGCYSIAEIQTISPNVFCRQDVLQAERHILLLLNWDLNPVTPLSFLSHLLCLVCPLWSTPASVWKDVWLGANKHLQQCCHDVRLLEFSASEVASAAMLLSLEDRALASDEARYSLEELLDDRQENLRRCRSVMVDISLDASDWTSLLLHCEEVPVISLHKDQSSIFPDTDHSPRSVLTN